MAQFAKINRLQHSDVSGYDNSIQMIQSSESTYYNAFIWLIHVLFGIEQYISPSATSSESGGNVINGSYWMPTPSGNPLTMIIPGILVGAISKLFVCILLFIYLILIF